MSIEIKFADQVPLGARFSTFPDYHDNLVRVELCSMLAIENSTKPCFTDYNESNHRIVLIINSMLVRLHDEQD